MRGTVIKRGSSWSVVIDLGRDRTGRRVRKWHSGYRTKMEAERARTELLSQVDRGSYVPPTKLTLGTFLTQEWLPAKRATVKETTLASYEVHVVKHVVPRLGGVPLLGLAAAHLNAFYADLLLDGRRDGCGGLSPTTVRRIHATLHKALVDGVRWGRLPRNPADQADPPRAATTEMSVWSPVQLRTFIDSVRADRLFAAWLLAATTGMRRGELLGLRWRDVDLDAETASIRQIRTIARYEVLTLTPKTDKGSRTIALDPQTVAVLRSYRVAQMEERLLLSSGYRDSGDLVFTREDGSPIHPERFSASFRQHCARSGLPVIRLHDVRHSYVTALLSEGVPLKVVSQRVGHASPMVTMTIYHTCCRKTTEWRPPSAPERFSATGSWMPRLSYFYGIAIYLYYEDHDPPHVHARYGEDQARIVIATGAVLDGSLPRRAQRMVDEWVAAHRMELTACWERAVSGREPGTIEPLN